MPPTCPKCGAELVPGRRACPACGAVVSAGEYQVEVPAGGEVKLDPQVEAGEPSRRGCLVPGAVVLLVLAAVAARVT